jgi:purine-nucleoside/S-methyl-5'-thioadenosine phosphorylase / adenosine deaminase
MSAKSPSLLPGSPFALWPADRGRARIRFIGRRRSGPLEGAPGSGRPQGGGSESGALARLRELAPPGVELSWARQIHSATVLAARPGASGDGDALTTATLRLALAIATADCVPVALYDPEGGSLAAVHAGWRGIVAGVATSAAAALDAPRLVAWIGPAIGPCCYEVGDEVADAVADASDSTVVRRDPGSRPFLDLQRAVALQLRAAGVAEVQAVEVCTRCHPELLWSYRRDRQAAGRNYLLAWLV